MKAPSAPILIFIADWINVRKTDLVLCELPLTLENWWESIAPARRHGLGSGQGHAGWLLTCFFPSICRSHWSSRKDQPHSSFAGILTARHDRSIQSAHWRMHGEYKSRAEPAGTNRELFASGHVPLGSIVVAPSARAGGEKITGSVFLSTVTSSYGHGRYGSFLVHCLRWLAGRVCDRRRSFWMFLVSILNLKII